LGACSVSLAIDKANHSERVGRKAKGLIDAMTLDDSLATEMRFAEDLNWYLE
jgi:hypothetical protein